MATAINFVSIIWFSFLWVVWGALQIVKFVALVVWAIVRFIALIGVGIMAGLGAFIMTFALTMWIGFSRNRAERVVTWGKNQTVFGDDRPLYRNLPTPNPQPSMPNGHPLWHQGQPNTSGIPF
jgi:hypothetical protein